MANIDAPFGLRALLNQAGTAPDIMEVEADAGGSSIGEGSLVYIIAGTGTDNEVVDIWDGTTDVPILGAAVHQRATGDTTRTLLVYSDPEQRYEVQVDDGTITHASDLVGSHFTVTTPTGINSNTQQSTTELTGASGQAAADADNVLLGVRLSRDPEVDYTTANPTVVVKIAHSRHIFGSDGGVA